MLYFPYQFVLSPTPDGVPRLSTTMITFRIYPENKLQNCHARGVISI